MGDFGERKNSEGYADPTAYQAIKNMVKPGEIWRMKTDSGKENEVLAVACTDNVVTILYLVDTDKGGCVPVGSKWVNPAMLNWTWRQFLPHFVRKLSESEFAEVLGNIQEVLRLKVAAETKETTAGREKVNDPTLDRALGILEGLSYTAEKAMADGILDAVVMIEAAFGGKNG